MRTISTASRSLRKHSVGITTSSTPLLLTESLGATASFAYLDSQSLRKMLIDEDALAAYRDDPFNPHAIARTRLSAYQKSIVMKYIDNLLDWGDSLFNQFTMESVNEATMLYVMAQDILGPRPARAGLLR